MISPQRAVFNLAITDPKWVRAYVSDPDLGKIHPGMKASITADSFPGRAFSGWVGFISSVAEFTPKAVETVELRSSLVYEIRVFVQDPQDELRLGMPATVALELNPAAQRQALGIVSSQCRWTKILSGLAAASAWPVARRLHRRPGLSPSRRATRQSAWSSPVADGLTDNAAAASSWWTSFNDAELDSLIQRAAQDESGFARVRSPAAPSPGGAGHERGGFRAHGRCHGVFRQTIAEQEPAAHWSAAVAGELSLRIQRL